MYKFKKRITTGVVLVFLISVHSGCISPRKMDTYVAGQYGNQLPKPDKRKPENINISTTLAMDPAIISTTEKKNKMLPLLLYWQWDYRHTCTLNSAIGFSAFTKVVNSIANKELAPKLNGRQLELTVEQVPASFAIVDKGGAIWVILYAIHWDKVYVELDPKQLIVTYKLLQNGAEVKTGRLSVNNPEKERGIRFFQSWKSATSEYLARYNLDMTAMAKTFVARLAEEL